MRKSKKMKKNKNLKMLKETQRGITLVALVITIIIIIILATVTINMAFGDNGLITQAQKAKDMTLNSVTAEQEGMNSVMSEYLNVMAEDSEITPPNPPTPTDPTEQVATEIGTVTKGEEFTETTKVSDASGDIFYVPGGFGIASDSATDIDDGIVITNSNNTKQFVWIPVDSTSLNEMYTVEETPLSTYTGVDAKTSVYSKLRGQDGSPNHGGKPGGTTTSYREPDILINTTYGDASTTTDKGINLIKSAFGFEGTNEQVLDQFADMLVAEYETTYASIEKYDGFYIGRYELTGNVDTPTVQKGQEVLTNQNWYQLYKACSNVVTGAEYGAQSTMIYGNQWDEVLDWLVDTGMSSSDVYTNSASWGNYSDSSGNAATGSGTKRTSGYSEYWQANNIYDLAGNCYECTQEAGGTDIRVGRGGTYHHSGSYVPASVRHDNQSYPTDSSLSSRVAMYLT